MIAVFVIFTMEANEQTEVTANGVFNSDVNSLVEQYVALCGTLRDCSVFIGIYVDDILLTCSSPSLADTIIQDLEKEYKQLKVTRGTTHDYLGMVLDSTQNGIVRVPAPQESILSQ